MNERTKPPEAAPHGKRPFFLKLASLPLSFLTLVVVMMGLLHLDASMTGWKSLASRYSAKGEPANVKRSQDADVGTIGLVRVKSLYRTAATDEGLYLAMPGIVSAGHTPLLVPWSELKVTNDSNTLGTRVLVLEAGEPSAGKITIRGGIVGDVATRVAQVEAKQ